MRIFVAFAIILTSITHSRLNASAADEIKPLDPKHEESEQLFALYNPCCHTCGKINIRGGLDEQKKQLTLAVTKDGKPISDTVMLWGNQLHARPKGSKDDGPMGRFQWGDSDRVKLSLAVKLQYRGTTPSQYNLHTSVYLPIEDCKFSSIYIGGKFLIINADDKPSVPLPHPRLLLATTHGSATAVVAAIKSHKVAYPLIVVDMEQCLIKFFGHDWALKLPIYRNPATKEIMTQAELDARYSKATK
jgi:hypothetical protein